MNKLFYVQVMQPEDVNWTMVRIVASEREAARACACKMGIVGLITEGSYDDLSDDDPVFYPSGDDYNLEAIQAHQYAFHYDPAKWSWVKYVDWPAICLIALILIVGLFAIKG